MTIVVDDDAEAARIGHVKARKVPIRIFIEFESASKVAERRSQEDLAISGKTTVIANRSARKLYPGLPVVVEGVANGNVQRIVGVQVMPLEGAVKIFVIPDTLGVTAPIFVNEDSTEGKEPPVSSPQDDRAFHLIEVPPYENQSGELEIMVPRIRAHNQTGWADLWFSLDDTTYFLSAREFDVHTGGFLLDALTADGPAFQATGPRITILGPDVSVGLDLSADEAGWAAGAQWGVFENGEICYIQELVNLGGNDFRLDGFLRGRLATAQQAQTGNIIIFPRGKIEILQEGDFVLDAAVFAKTEPFVGSVSVPITNISPKSISLRGVGINRPFDTTGLIAGVIQATGDNSFASAFESGDDIVISWNYRSLAILGTGAGFQGAGLSSGTGPVIGEFILTFSTVGDVVQRVESDLSSPTFTYTAAQRIADFTTNVNFKVEVKHLANGLESIPEEITVSFQT